jgi:LytS/YehU family sensor histidine kinase
MRLAARMKLTDIVDLSTLHGVQEKMGKLVSIPQITTDAEGIPVGKISNFIPFCKLIRSSAKGSEQCILCDRQAGLLAMEEKQRRIYTCHTGLIDCAAPIIINGMYLGSVLGGQVLLKGEKNRDAMDVERISKQFDISLDVLKVAVEFIPVISREELQDSVECYSLLASYIDQIGGNRLAQEQLLIEAKEKLLLEQKARQMKFKNIYDQIQPHFLFNTLNSIARMALLENAAQTEELIYNLSDLLRYNLKHADNFPRIRDEVSNIKKYLYIQSLSYSDRIAYEMDIDEAIMDYRIPSMILQPIVENSMVHGLETKKEGGKIQITGRLVSKYELEIKVIDNGRGMKSDVLELIRQMGERSNANLGIGLLNTYDRLKYYFGDRGRLTIESAPDAGTCVSIRIPCGQSYP